MRYFGRCCGADTGLMPKARGHRGASYRGTMRAALACALCVVMIDQPLLAAASVVKHGPSAGVQPMR